jgi:hypothetical protein
VIGVDATSFLVIVATAAIASLAVTVLGPRVAISVIVVEILLGIEPADTPAEACAP